MHLSVSGRYIGNLSSKSDFIIDYDDDLSYQLKNIVKLSLSLIVSFVAGAGAAAARGTRLMAKIQGCGFMTAKVVEFG